MAKVSLWRVVGIDRRKEEEAKGAVRKLLRNYCKSNHIPVKLRRDTVEAVSDFFLFCFERHSMWERRNKGEDYPWSKCETLNEYFFCNVFREIDRGTAYLRAHVIQRREVMSERRQHRRILMERQQARRRSQCATKMKENRAQVLAEEKSREVPSRKRFVPDTDSPSRDLTPTRLRQRQRKTRAVDDEMDQDDNSGKEISPGHGQDSETRKSGHSQEQEWASFDDEMLKDVLWSSICYRLINRIETFQYAAQTRHIGGDWCKVSERYVPATGIPSVDEWEEFLEVIAGLTEDRSIQGAVFTCAHQSLSLPKYIAAVSALLHNDTLSDMTNQIRSEASMHRSLEGCVQIVSALPYVGRFYAWQVVCDLLEAKVILPCTEDDWVQLGPGAYSGVKVIFGSLDGDGALAMSRMLRDTQVRVYEAMGLKCPEFFSRCITLKNIEHALCEFFKFSQLSRNAPCGRQRLWDLDSRSRSLTCDVGKICPLCFRGEDEDDMATEGDRMPRYFCDLCLRLFCESCIVKGPITREGIKNTPSWICPSCCALERRDEVEESWEGKRPGLRPI